MYAYRFTDDYNIVKTDWSYCAGDFEDKMWEVIHDILEDDVSVYLEILDLNDYLEVYDLLNEGYGLRRNKGLERIKILEVLEIYDNILDDGEITHSFKIRYFEDVDKWQMYIEDHNARSI